MRECLWFTNIVPANSTLRVHERGNHEYQLDEKGQKVLDANGNPIENAKTSAKSVLTVDDALFDMVQEEAQSYFSGQKSVEDVVKIILSMAGIYVSENY